MERRLLGTSGLHVPAVGVGTARVFNVRGDPDQARCEAVVDAALESGANLFDTSPMYGEAERVLAVSLGDRRVDSLVATKVWARTRAIGEQQVEQALGWFGHVDLYQIHNALGAEDYLPMLSGLRRSGHVRAIGITHYLPSSYPRLLELMRTRKVDAVQVPYHPGERTAEEEILPEADRLGIGIIAMTPFGTGRLFEHAPPDEALAPLAGAGVHTWAQALLKWALSDPRVSCAIPATSRSEHMRVNASAGDPPWLSVDERRLIEDLTRAWISAPAAAS
ncbi:MAG TPA: aldo/keto reductase [Kofleriaceae bacterium]|nr:aldo/keto reductase [Kofleriaceae bacterium]